MVGWWMDGGSLTRPAALWEEPRTRCRGEDDVVCATCWQYSIGPRELLVRCQLLHSIRCWVKSSSSSAGPTGARPWVGAVEETGDWRGRGPRISVFFLCPFRDQDDECHILALDEYIVFLYRISIYSYIHIAPLMQIHVIYR
jgi:hypothetical protein